MKVLRGSRDRQLWVMHSTWGGDGNDHGLRFYRHGPAIQFAALANRRRDGADANLHAGHGRQGRQPSRGRRPRRGTVRFVGSAGADGFGNEARSLLHAEATDLAGFATVDAATCVASVCFDTQGRNQIAVASGANLLTRADALRPEILASGDWLVLQMEIPSDEVSKAVALAKARGGLPPSTCGHACSENRRCATSHENLLAPDDRALNDTIIASCKGASLDPNQQREIGRAAT